MLRYAFGVLETCLSGSVFVMALALECRSRIVDLDLEGRRLFLPILAGPGSDGVLAALNRFLATSHASPIKGVQRSVWDSWLWRLASSWGGRNGEFLNGPLDTCVFVLEVSRGRFRAPGSDAWRVRGELYCPGFAVRPAGLS